MRTTAKQILWPVRGVEEIVAYHDATPDTAGATRTYAAPFAVNVRTEGPIEGRRRGGSRPGLKRLTGVIGETGGVWRWPNGGAIQWEDGSSVRFALPTTRYTGPDGAPFVNPHQPYAPTASKGSVPSGAQAMAWYRYRLFVAKDAQWYASRSGDATDWDYGGDMEDLGRAASGNVALAGLQGEKITAMMPVADRMLYIATERALWRLDGEPTSGSCKLVMEGVGCVGPNAWCWDGIALWWLSPNGVFALVPGEGPTHFTGALPNLRGTDANALMVADHDANGIHLFSAVDGDWFFDPDGKASWPVAIPATMRPAAAAHVVSAHRNITALLCADGKWRHFDDSQATDDGTAFTSRIAFGPFRISDADDADGFLAELHATLAELPQQQTVTVTAKLWTAHSAERAVKLAKAGTGGTSFDFVAGWNAVWRPRARGAWGVLALESSGLWAFESVRAICKHLGRLRP